MRYQLRDVMRQTDLGSSGYAKRNRAIKWQTTKSMPSSLNTNQDDGKMNWMQRKIVSEVAGQSFDFPIAIPDRLRTVPPLNFLRALGLVLRGATCFCLG